MIRTDHGRAENGGREKDMALHVEWFVVEEVLFDDFSTHEQLEWERRKHVQPEAKSRNVDQSIILCVKESVMKDMGRI